MSRHEGNHIRDNDPVMSFRYDRYHLSFLARTVTDKFRKVCETPEERWSAPYNRITAVCVILILTVTLAIFTVTITTSYGGHW